MKRQYPDDKKFVLGAGGISGAGGAPGTGGGGGKRYRADPYNEAIAEGKFELRILIPTKMAGAVIGKGGEYIKSIREKFDATLTVPDKSTPERVLTIICRQETLIDCFKEVLAKLVEDQKQGDTELRVMVHQSHAGAIIGRGGSKIKELREQTGTHLKVFQECCPHSTDRVLLISGASEKLPDAVRVVVDFMRDVPIKGMQKPYDPTNYDPHIAFNYGGIEDRRYVGPPPMGRGGRGGGGGPMGAHYDAPYGRGVPPSAMGGGYGGGYGAGAPPPGGYGASAYGGYNSGSAGFGGRGVVGGPAIAPMGGAPASGYVDGAVTTTQVTIPNDLGGTIIGRGGERINSIRRESGAKIEVGQPTFGAEERIITITGTPHQIQTAQYLLQQSVRGSEAGRRYLQEQR